MATGTSTGGAVVAGAAAAAVTAVATAVEVVGVVAVLPFCWLSRRLHNS